MKTELRCFHCNILIATIEAGNLKYRCQTARHFFDQVFIKATRGQKTDAGPSERVAPLLLGQDKGYQGWRLKCRYCKKEFFRSYEQLLTDSKAPLVQLHETSVDDSNRYLNFLP